MPKGWWPRYPDVPYKLRAFDALFAEPLDTITYTRSLAQTAWEKLDPAELAKSDAGRNSRSLFQAVQRLGIDPKFGGFRGYTANVLAPEMPLDQAIIKLYEAARRSSKPHTFGMDLPYPKIQEELTERVQVLPEGVSPILGQLVLNIIDAHYWVELAFRKVDARDLMTVSKRLNVGMEMIDAYDYCPAFDDVAKAGTKPPCGTRPRNAWMRSTWRASSCRSWICRMCPTSSSSGKHRGGVFESLVLVHLVTVVTTATIAYFW